MAEAQQQIYTRSDIMPQMRADVGIDRRVPRYLFLGGDFIYPQRKRQVPFGWAGGLDLDPNEFKTCWRLKHTIVRGAFVPFETRAAIATADMHVAQKRDGRNRVTMNASITGKNNAFYEVLPGPEVSDLLGSPLAEQGLVEIECLRGAEFDKRLPVLLQTAIFPDWDDWMQRRKAIPEKLADWEALVREAARDPKHPLVESAVVDMTTSFQNFRTYANKLIGQNRKLVERGANQGGHVAIWEPMTRHLAYQLDVDIEPEASMGKIATNQNESQKQLGGFFETLALQMASDREATMELLKQNSEIIELLAERIKTPDENVTAVTEALRNPVEDE